MLQKSLPKFNLMFVYLYSEECVSIKISFSWKNTVPFTKVFGGSLKPFQQAQYMVKVTRKSSYLSNIFLKEIFHRLRPSLDFYNVISNWNY